MQAQFDQCWCEDYSIWLFVESLISISFIQNRRYNAKIDLGKLLNRLLCENKELKEEALNSEKKRSPHALSEITATCQFWIWECGPWQERVISFIKTPTKREVMWVVGEQGNEGKAFLQHCIRFCYGDQRVVTTDIVGNKTHIAHYLSKRSLVCKDIFIFNHPCSNEETVAYDLLEGIKDGCVLSHKYDTKQLIFNAPNTVIAFSNSHPYTPALKPDRWRVFTIKDNELHGDTKSGSNSLRHFSTAGKNKRGDTKDIWICIWTCMIIELPVNALMG